MVNGHYPAQANGTRTIDRFWDLALKIGVIVTVAVATAAINHEVRLGKIEDSRFTSADALKLERSLRDWSDERYPQNWLREDMGDIKTGLETLDNRMRALETKVGN